MFLYFGRPLSLHDIPKRLQSAAQLRSNFSIAVIDDQPFAYAELLRHHHFSLIEIGDISHLDSISSYPIIVCDIKGVGKAFGGKHEGAHVVAEVRKKFPDKYIIAFSGSTFDATFQKFFEMADETIKKDADAEDWVTALDQAIDYASDAAKRWVRVRKHLIKLEVDLFDVLLVEKAYVKCIRKGEISPLESALEKLYSKQRNSETVRRIGHIILEIAKTCIDLKTLSANG